MPTRPVTWDLDVPPEDLLEQVKPPPLPGDPPNIDKLRALLTGTRFELLKISTFAVFLLSFVAIAVHGSHLNNPDNPFVANTDAAFKDLAGTVSHQTVALGDKTAALALTATHRAEAALGHPALLNPPTETAQADTSAHDKSGAMPHHHAHPVRAEQVQVAALVARPVHHARKHENPVEVASGEASNSQWSGSLLGLSNFVTAEGNKARGLIDAVEQGEAKPASKAHATAMSHKHAASASTRAAHQSSLLDQFLAPDSMLAAMAALLLYLLFVVILVQMKGGLRATAGDQVTA